MSRAVHILEDLKSLGKFSFGLIIAEARELSLNLLAEQLLSEQAKCTREMLAIKKNLKLIEHEQLTEDEQLRLIRQKMVKLESTFPKAPHPMLQLALGKSGPFILRPFKQKIEFKKEYEVFKLRMTILGCFFAAFSLFVYSNRLTDALFAFLLLYYYCSAVLRQHILVVNGSRIRPWWLVHHYLSVITSGILLIWPSSPSYLAFRTPFFSFSLYLGLLQWLQYRYQIQRLYVLISLEKARPMDTVVGDGASMDKLGKDLLVLFPFSLVAQFWQLYNSYTMWNGYFYQDHREWQVAAVGILFAALGMGNLVTTLRIMAAKKKSKLDKE